MLFKLPDPPAGQSFVTKATANGPTTVLVPTSSLSEDICAATGRTWAEEARLYNIRNAPDGKQIAEPGDPLYQTADSMKNRNKQLGGITASTLKNFNQLAILSPGAAPPNLSETMNAISGGSIKADITANLSKIGEVAGSLPAGASAQLAQARTEIAAKMAAAQAELPKLMAMAQMNVDILTKKKIAETGKPPTEAEIKAAQGALTIFQDGPKLLESKAAEIGKAVAQAGTDFGAALNKGVSSASSFAKAGIGKVTELAKSAGAKITEFANTVPSQTIPDPNNPGQTIPNPAFASFSANPANALKLTKLSEVTTAMNSAAADMMSKFGAIEQKQTDAAVGTMATLKAFAFAAKLSQPVTGLAAQVQSFALDSSKFDPASISQTFAQASKLGPSIDTSVYKKTKDEDLTYKGDDGIVWDRVNTERERRGLPGLAAIGSPRPPEPPLVPAGSTPPKDPTTVTTSAKETPTKDPAPVTAPNTPKRVILGQPEDRKIYKAFVLAFWDLVQIWEKASEDAANTVRNTKTLVRDWVGESENFDYERIRTESQRIAKEKPDASTRTEEEKRVIKERDFWVNLYKDNSSFYQKYRFDLARRNELMQQYAILKKAWEEGKTFGDLPPSVQDIVKKNDDWRIDKPNAFKTYAEFAKANPDKATFKG